MGDSAQGGGLGSLGQNSGLFVSILDPYEILVSFGEEELFLNIFAQPFVHQLFMTGVFFSFPEQYYGN